MIAADLYKLAADNGDLDGQYNLGHVFEHGKGVALDGKRATELYREAAKNGHTYAQNNLGRMFEDGRG